jgi:hypothetical protein
LKPGRNLHLAALEIGAADAQRAHFAFPASIVTVPSISAMTASPLGLRASKTSSTRGKTLRNVVGAGHTTGVEGAQRQLRARLADGLGSDDADRLAHLDLAAACQIFTIALLHRCRSALHRSAALRTKARLTLCR